WGDARSQPPEGAQQKRSSTLRPPPPVLDAPSADQSEVRARHLHDPLNTAVGGSMLPTSVSAAPGARLQNLVAADLAEPITVQRADGRAQPVPERMLAVPIGPSPSALAAPPVVTPGHDLGFTGRGLAGDATIQDGGPSFADTIPLMGETATQID